MEIYNPLYYWWWKGIQTARLYFWWWNGVHPVLLVMEIHNTARPYTTECGKEYTLNGVAT
jgi:hypothetical protein